MQRIALLVLVVAAISVGWAQSTWRGSTTEGRVSYYYDGAGEAFRLLTAAALGEDFIQHVRFSSPSGSEVIVGCTTYTYLGSQSGSLLLRARNFTGIVNPSANSNLAGLRANPNSVQYAQGSTYGCDRLLIFIRDSSTTIYSDVVLYIPINTFGSSIFSPRDLIEVNFTAVVGVSNLLGVEVTFD